MTFLEETIEKIKQSGHNTADVLWVGSSDGEYAISWEEFTMIAGFDYDSGWGSQKIATDLVVVFHDGGWLDRHSYDGSEWWVFKKTPSISPSPKKFQRLTGRFGWETVHGYNKREEA